MFLVSKFKQIVNSAFNYNEALDRQNIRQESVNLLREKVKSIESVPKFIFDRQVDY